MDWRSLVVNSRSFVVELVIDRLGTGSREAQTTLLRAFGRGQRFEHSLHELLVSLLLILGVLRRNNDSFHALLANDHSLLAPGNGGDILQSWKLLRLQQSQCRLGLSAL